MLRSPSVGNRRSVSPTLCPAGANANTNPAASSLRIQEPVYQQNAWPSSALELSKRPSLIPQRVPKIVMHQPRAIVQRLDSTRMVDGMSHPLNQEGYRLEVGLVLAPGART